MVKIKFQVCVSVKLKNLPQLAHLDPNINSPGRKSTHPDYFSTNISILQRNSPIFLLISLNTNQLTAKISSWRTKVQKLVYLGK